VDEYPRVAVSHFAIRLHCSCWYVYSVHYFFCPVLEPPVPIARPSRGFVRSTVEWTEFAGRILAMVQERPENGTVIDRGHTGTTSRSLSFTPLLRSSTMILFLFVPHDLHMDLWH
jgi:hypothetical protein